MLEPSVPRIGSGVTSLVSVQRMALEFSGAGATVAVTGANEAALVGDSEDNGAAREIGARVARCMRAREKESDRILDRILSAKYVS